ncbi:AmmeMemoRadiSam system radical SAM enzyme [Candidatus Aerophobetes bacterium]|nr:AmmeMemoRadiSam system radical SAM enzyme [Candidatus Aerophobetes bacterium]
MIEARFYQKLEDGKVKCMLCPHTCVLEEGKRGICGARENKQGKLFSLVYGKVISLAIDPIEKKPLYHFLPGEDALSLATAGCNFRCLNCQNYTISQNFKEKEIPGEKISPEQLVRIALERRTKIIAYTYTEPTIFYEYAYDTCFLAKKEGIRNVFVTNGYIMPEPLKEISPFLDGANVDLKSIREEVYRRVCGGKLQPVLESIKLMKELGIWVEITTLVIPGINDKEEEFEKLAEFICQLDPGIPWHISRFYPAYKMQDYPWTPVEKLHRARKIGLEKGLKYVYTGNVPGEESENTFCPVCGRKIIQRRGFYVERIEMKNGKCLFCESTIEGVLE